MKKLAGIFIIAAAFINGAENRTNGPIITKPVITLQATRQGLEALEVLSSDLKTLISLRADMLPESTDRISAERLYGRITECAEEVRARTQGLLESLHATVGSILTPETELIKKRLQSIIDQIRVAGRLNIIHWTGDTAEGNVTKLLCQFNDLMRAVRENYQYRRSDAQEDYIEGLSGLIRPTSFDAKLLRDAQLSRKGFKVKAEGTVTDQLAEIIRRRHLSLQSFTDLPGERGKLAQTKRLFISLLYLLFKKTGGVCAEISESLAAAEQIMKEYPPGSIEAVIKFLANPPLNSVPGGTDLAFRTIEQLCRDANRQGGTRRMFADKILGALIGSRLISSDAISQVKEIVRTQGNLDAIRSAINGFQCSVQFYGYERYLRWFIALLPYLRIPFDVVLNPGTFWMIRKSAQLWQMTSDRLDSTANTLWGHSQDAYKQFLANQLARQQAMSFVMHDIAEFRQVAPVIERATTLDQLVRRYLPAVNSMPHQTESMQNNQSFMSRTLELLKRAAENFPLIG